VAAAVYVMKLGLRGSFDSTVGQGFVVVYEAKLRLRDNIDSRPRFAAAYWLKLELPSHVDPGPEFRGGIRSEAETA